MAENWDAEDAPAVTAGTVTVAELPEVKLFGKWSTDDVQVSDISLTVRYYIDCLFNMLWFVAIYNPSSFQVVIVLKNEVKRVF